jgi:hypothetical protein
MIDEKDIPDNVIHGLEVVRQSGKYNMLCESQNIFVELYHLGYYEAVSWLYDETREQKTGNQVNSEKYVAALKLLGTINGVANKLK